MKHPSKFPLTKIISFVTLMIIVIIGLFLAFVSYRDTQGAFNENDFSSDKHAVIIEPTTQTQQPVQRNLSEDDESILIYSIGEDTGNYAVAENIFNLPINRIPYYQNGEIMFFSESEIKAFDEKNKYFNRNNVLDCTILNCKNLIGSDELADQIFGTGGLKASEGVQITVIQESQKSASTKLEVSGLGEYIIEFESPPDIDYLFVKSIVFYPNYGDLLTDKKLLLYALPTDTLDYPIEHVPYYSEGKIEFKKKEYFDYLAKGHQPWRTSPTTLTSIICRNLYGSVLLGEIKEKNQTTEIDTPTELKTSVGIHIKATNTHDNIFIVELSVPQIGKYMITMQDIAIDYITKIEFLPIGKSL